MAWGRGKLPSLWRCRRPRKIRNHVLGMLEGELIALVGRFAKMLAPVVWVAAGPKPMLEIRLTDGITAKRFCSQELKTHW